MQVASKAKARNQRQRVTNTAKVNEEFKAATRRGWLYVGRTAHDTRKDQGAPKKSKVQ